MRRTGLAPGTEGERDPGRCGWRSRRSGRCCRWSSRPRRRRPARSARRSPSCSWRTCGSAARAGAGGPRGASRGRAGAGPGEPDRRRRAGAGAGEPEPAAEPEEPAGQARASPARRSAAAGSGCPASRPRPRRRCGLRTVWSRLRTFAPASHARLRAVVNRASARPSGGGPFAVVGCASARLSNSELSRRTFLSSFLTHHGVLVALVCAGARDRLRRRSPRARCSRCRPATSACARSPPPSRRAPAPT